VERRIENEHDQDQSPRRQIAKALRLLIDCQRLCKTTDAHGKRLANQTVTTGIDIDEDEEATLRLVEPIHIASTGCAPSTSGENTHVRGSTTSKIVGLHRYFSNPSKPRRTLISRVTQGSKTLQPRTGTRHTTDSRGPMREDSSQSQTRLSASNREELLVGYAEGVPVQELARRFNTHRATVREIARRAGHPSRAPEHSQQLRSEAAHLYAERFALSQVAAQLGIGDEAVRSAVVANGGKIRPKGRRRSHA